MMISEAFVWIWLEGETSPVVAGKLTEQNGGFFFNYGKSYLERENAIAIYDKELPLQAGVLPQNIEHKDIPSCIRDSAPDAWGRRVILNKLLGAKGKDADSNSLNDLTYLLESGSDRIGALDFQASSSEYQPRITKNASLEELLESASRVEEGIPLTTELDKALHHGSSIGGARPKALIDTDNKKYIAKFSLSTDVYNIIKAEFIAMRLAVKCGLSVANVELVKASGKDVLLIERFDRKPLNNSWERKLMLSALTLLNLTEMTARYASYEDFAEIIRHRFDDPKQTLKEMFSRIVFNILCGNTDDHARNHAAFWNGENLSLTPAYDICPQMRSGGEASQAMLIAGNNRMSKISTCLDTTHNFMLSKEQANEIIESQIQTIKNNWDNICEEAALNQVEKSLLWKRLFLNPFVFE